jgi:AAA family ATP:ADP antiporter
MAYLPLQPEVRAAGQAAIDVLGGRLGKSGAALLQQLVIILCGGEIVRGVRAIGAMYACATLAWIWAINSLARKLPARLLQRAAQTPPADG